MGLLSKIKTAFGGILAGGKKVFKSVMGTVAKALSNKWVQGALMVCSLVVPVIGMASAGWSAAAGQGVMAQMGSALSNIARGIGSMVLKTVTTPIKMLAQGGADVAGMFNANGLAATLSDASKTVGGLSDSIFGTVKMDSFGQILGKMGLTGAEGATGNPEVAQASGAVADTAKGMTESGGQFGDIGKAVDANGNLIGDAASSAASATPAGTVASSASAPGGGLLSRAAGFIQKNPEVAKLGFQAINSALSPDESDLMAQKYKLQNQYDQKTADQWNNFNANPAGSPATAAPANQFQQIDYKNRAQTARDFINGTAQPAIQKAPLLNRPYFGVNYAQ